MRMKGAITIPDRRWVRFVEVMTGKKYQLLNFEPTEVQSSELLRRIFSLGSEEFVLWALYAQECTADEALMSVRLNYQSIRTIFDQTIQSAQRIRDAEKEFWKVNNKMVRYAPFRKKTIEESGKLLGVRIRFDDRGFWIGKSNILLIDKLGHEFLLDEAEARIGFDGKPVGINCKYKNLWIGTSYDNMHVSISPHPHWSSGGTPCLGNRTEDYTLYRSANEWYYMMEIISDCLSTYNDESPYTDLWEWSTLFKRLSFMHGKRSERMSIRCPQGHNMLEEGGYCVEPSCSFGGRKLCPKCNHPIEFENPQIANQSTMMCWNPACEDGRRNLLGSNVAYRRKMKQAAKMVAQLKQNGEETNETT